MEGWQERVTVATKKRSVPSDYVAVSSESHLSRWRDTHYDKNVNSMIFRAYSGNQTIGTRWWSKYEQPWTDYFQGFAGGGKKPKIWKPSIGTMAVYMAFERWRPEAIGLIGMDWVLDGNPDWFHDAEVEKKSIEALPVKIIDLRGRRNTGQQGLDEG